MADFPPTVNVTPKPEKKPESTWTGSTIKGTRQKVLDAIAGSSLSAAHKAALTEDVNSIDVAHELIRVDFHRHKHGAGWNTGYTVMEL